MTDTAPSYASVRPSPSVLFYVMPLCGRIVDLWIVIMLFGDPMRPTALVRPSTDCYAEHRKYRPADNTPFRPSHGPSDSFPCNHARANVQRFLSVVTPMPTHVAA